MKKYTPTAFETVESRYVRCADEDDDRRGPDGRPLNPRAEAARERAYKAIAKATGWRRALRTPIGWSPAIHMASRDGPELLDRSVRGHGYFAAYLTREASGRWRISCWGGDDLSLTRRDMDEATARSVWARLNDFVTMRTLRFALRLRHE